ncbi:hypothetical protein KOR42_38740 [Thalassoglobus neptunius]|uniref:Double zinc ribbon n=1 Tax=Thalassoglobus neptunius TaxID=1938619 RepID=A0A5C5WIZ4_9PLAN|nr:hypothetical protein [Thalassoglobus neptunius]TWT49802.1 hypothetical protein KOR42_38740 [Thalassoglobus neptunius]
MTIEFYCPECQAYLRANATKAGLSVQCPHCNGRTWVPFESEPQFDGDEFSEWEEPVVDDSANEPALLVREERLSPTSQIDESDSSQISKCPRCGSAKLQKNQKCVRCELGAEGVSPATPGEVDLSRILSDTWSIYTKNFPSCYAVTLIDLLFTVLGLIFSLMIGGVCASISQQPPEIAILLFFVVSLLGMSVCFAVLAVGHLSFYLDLCRTRTPDLQKSFEFRGPIGTLLISGIIYWMTFVLIFPLFFLWPFGRIVVDQNQRGVSPLRGALRLTLRNLDFSLSLGVLKIGAFFAANLIPVVGQILIVPYLAILNTVAYLHLIGEQDSFDD